MEEIELDEAKSDSQTENEAADTEIPPIEPPLPTDPAHLRYQQFNFYARVLAIISFCLELASAVGGILAGAILNNAALIAFGLSSAVDVVATAFVVWRFFGVDDDTPQKLIETREKKADVGVAFGIVAIAVAICIESGVHISKLTGPDDSQIVTAIAIVSICIYSALACAKFYVAFTLKSGALRKDGISSIAVVALASGVLVAAQVFKQNPKIWWLDSAVGLWASAALFPVGIYTLSVEREHEWHTWDFWKNYGEENAVGSTQTSDFEEKACPLYIQT